VEDNDIEKRELKGLDISLTVMQKNPSTPRKLKETRQGHKALQIQPQELRSTEAAPKGWFPQDGYFSFETLLKEGSTSASLPRPMGWLNFHTVGNSTTIFWTTY
jgi:hypothetical protein